MSHESFYKTIEALSHLFGYKENVKSRERTLWTTAIAYYVCVSLKAEAVLRSTHWDRNLSIEQADSLAAFCSKSSPFWFAVRIVPRRALLSRTPSWLPLQKKIHCTVLSTGQAFGGAFWQKRQVQYLVDDAFEFLITRSLSDMSWLFTFQQFFALLFFLNSRQIISLGLFYLSWKVLEEIQNPPYHMYTLHTKDSHGNQCQPFTSGLFNPVLFTPHGSQTRKSRFAGAAINKHLLPILQSNINVVCIIVQ